MTDAIQLLREAHELMHELEADGYRLVWVANELMLHGPNGIVDNELYTRVMDNQQALLVVIVISQHFMEIEQLLNDWAERELID